MLTAVGVSGGYLLIAVPNVELLSVTIAFSGLLLGGGSGAFVGLASGAIFGLLNVIGLPYPPVYLAQLAGYSLTGFIFGRFRMKLISSHPWAFAWKVGSLGFVCTFVYDTITNLAFPLATGVAPAHWWPYLTAAVPFAITHLVANSLIFALLLPPAWAALGKRFSL